MRLIPEKDGLAADLNGSIWNLTHSGWVQIRPILLQVGYYAVFYREPDGRRVQRYVHHLVLEAFVGPRPAGFHGCHSDGDPLNNRLANLRWASPKSNAADRDRHSRTSRGSRHWAAKLTESDIPKIRALAAQGMSTASIASRFGVTTFPIWGILVGKYWTHV